MKKFFFLLFIPIIAILFLQCSEQFVEPNDQETVLSLYLESTPNNLSFPGLLADGYTLEPITAPVWLNIYPDESLLTEEQKVYDWYAQKDGNIWQAQFEYTDAVDVSYIDWGDNIESFSPTAGKPFRLEVTLYKDISSAPMTGYTMALLANPSSPEEIQGTNKVTYPGDVATIASDKAKLVVQHYDDDVDASTLTWNGSSWDGADAEETVIFGVELNVGGKLIYGAAKKGWKPAQTGKYRITYYLSDSEVNLSNADIGPAPTDQVAFPEVSDAYNLTYVDIVVVPRSGGNTK